LADLACEHPFCFSVFLNQKRYSQKEFFIMDQPKIAARVPKQVELEAGKKYAYCTCGLSENQPFCDGRHKGSSFVPQVFTAEEAKTCYFCQCKQTQNAPYCDGSHKNCPAE